MKTRITSVLLLLALLASLCSFTAFADGEQTWLPGSSVTGSLSDRDDSAQIYRFELDKPGTLVYRVETEQTVVSADLRDANNKQIKYRESTKMPDGTTELEQSIDLSAGTYYLKVAHRIISTNNSAVRFTLSGSFTPVEVTFPEPQFGDNNVMEDADEIALGQQVKGFIANCNDVDFFRLRLEQTGKLTVQAASRAGHLIIRAMDRNKEELAQMELILNANSEQKEGELELILDAGDYWLKIEAFMSTGAYEFTTALEPIAESFPESVGQNNDSAETASELRLGSVYQGVMTMNITEKERETDWYTFQTEKPGTYTLFVWSNVKLHGTVMEEDLYEKWSRDIDEHKAKTRTFLRQTLTLGQGTHYLCFKQWNQFSYRYGAYSFAILDQCFDDVANPYEFFFEPVYWAVEHDPQITNGTGNGKFSPSDTCTRGQVVTFLWRANGQPEPKSGNHPFTDVRSEAYYYNAVLWAVENGITSGTGDGKFSPNGECTRGQVVTFLWRAAGNPKPQSTNNPFADVKKGAFYYDAVLWAVEQDVTKGTSKTAFSPAQTCTRGQVVTFLYRATGE